MSRFLTIKNLTPAAKPKNEWVTIEKSKIKLECNHKIIIAKPGGLELYKAVVSPIFAFIFLFYSPRDKVDAFLNRSFKLIQSGKWLNGGITFYSSVCVLLIVRSGYSKGETI